MRCNLQVDVIEQPQRDTYILYIYIILVYKYELGMVFRWTMAAEWYQFISSNILLYVFMSKWNWISVQQFEKRNPGRGCFLFITITTPHGPRQSYCMPFGTSTISGSNFRRTNVILIHRILCECFDASIHLGALLRSSRMWPISCIPHYTRMIGAACRNLPHLAHIQIWPQMNSDFLFSYVYTYSLFVSVGDTRFKCDRTIPIIHDRFINKCTNAEEISIGNRQMNTFLLRKSIPHNYVHVELFMFESTLFSIF